MKKPFTKQTIASTLARYERERKELGAATTDAFYEVVLAYLDKFEERLTAIDGRLASVINVRKS